MAKLQVKNRYATIPNELLNSPNLSLKAKGLFAYIQGKPDGREFSVGRMSKQLQEGKDAIRSAIKELEDAGYLARSPIKDKNGKRDGYDYILTEIPSSENPTTDDPMTENTDTISKKEYSKKEIEKKSEVLSNDNSKAEYGKKDINDLIEIIKEACKKNGLLYSGKGQTERHAAKWILSKKFLERISEFEMTLEQFVNNVVMVSTKLKYNTTQLTSAKLIYYHREDIVNKAKQQSMKTVEQAPVSFEAF